MKKIREITLSNILESIPSDDTLESKILKELPLHKKFSMKVLTDYYNVSKNVMYPIILKLTQNGTLVKSRGNFANRNNTVIYERIK